MPTKEMDHSKGPRPGRPGTDTGKFGPGFSSKTERSAAQDPPVDDWGGQGTSGGNTVGKIWYGHNQQTAGN